MSQRSLSTPHLRARTAEQQIRVSRVRTFTVELPYPSNALSQNARGAWQQYYPEQQRAKLDGYLAAIAAMNKCAYDPPRRGVTTWAVTVRFCPPDRRRRDVHNAFGALKHYVDGIAEAVGVDDSLFVKWVIEPFGAVVAGGTSTLTFEEMRV